MSKSKNLARASAFCVLLMVATCFSMVVMAKQDDEKVRCIVLFKDKVDKKLVEDNGGEILDTYEIIPGVVTELTKGEMKELKKSDKIKAVEEDAQATILGEKDADEEKANGNAKPSPPPAELQWGVDRIEAEKVWPAITQGSGIKVCIIDTGIDTDHPELTGRIAAGTSFLNQGKQSNIYEDNNGHGTHCAGIIAAAKNQKGVVGVAPQASLYIVKALDSRGSGWYSDFVLGIQWAVAQGVNVISMSFGGSSYDAAMEAACNSAQTAGVTLVAAAGNSAGSGVLYPAKFTSVIAVAATTSADKWATYSSYGAEVDIAAPGSSIYSTYLKGGYTTMSGTSMACPHVAGSVALLLNSGSARAQKFGDKDTTWDPADVQDCLQQTATDLGTASWDQYYGNGLVNVYEAVTGSHS